MAEATHSRRGREILAALKESGGTSRTAPLAARLGVSEETVRRNVKRLAAEGLVQRVHGGVHLPDDAPEPSFRQRMGVHPELKRRIAARVAGLIGDGASLFMDIGSTTAFIARALRERSRLFVVTNSVEVAHLLAARNGNRVFMAGGELRGHDGGAFGAEALAFVSRFQVDYAVFSAAALDAHSGFMLHDLEEAAFSRAIIARARTRIVAADSTKFDRSAPVAVGDPALVHLLVTDRPPGPELAGALRDWQIELVLADQSALRPE